MSSPEASAAKGPASPVMSTMAGVAPAASRTLAVRLVTTEFVRHWMSGEVSRTASRMVEIGRAHV